MSNTITEMKNTLEEVNSRVTEAEKRISELENRMVEITDTEQNKEKRIERNEDSLSSLGQHYTHQHLHYRGPRRRRERKDLRKYLKR